MTPIEVAEHLETQAKELENLATRYDYHHKPTEAQICKQRAINARLLAQQIANKHQNTIQELCQLTQLINTCNNHGYAWEACQHLQRLIEKFLLVNKEPYSSHYNNCGGR
jgi:DNA-directed RNA polymerase specialized sigma54-like protein